MREWRREPKGVIMGRNVFGYRDVPAMVKGISGIVHEDEAVEDALSII